MHHSACKTLLACLSPFLRDLLVSAGEEKCVIHVPFATNLSVRILLEVLHTGTNSKILSEEVWNVRKLLGSLGCSTEAGFIIIPKRRGEKKITLHNRNESMTNDAKYSQV